MKLQTWATALQGIGRKILNTEIVVDREAAKSAADRALRGIGIRRSAVTERRGTETSFSTTTALWIEWGPLTLRVPRASTYTVVTPRIEWPPPAGAEAVADEPLG